jgi:hypothetical protein
LEHLNLSSSDINHCTINLQNRKDMATSNKSSQKTSGVSIARDFNNALNSTLAFEAMRFTANYARMAKVHQSNIYINTGF